MTGKAALAASFRRFAERECAGVSALYHALGRAIAEDGRLLALAAGARPDQPAPNMLLGAVHFLLLTARPDDPLAAFYASLTSELAAPKAAFPAFRTFCLGNTAALAGLLRRRVVSTNEVGRSACLLPALADVATRAPAPLHLIEVGASAGLNLLWDRFAYDYGPAGRLDAENAALTLECTVRGPRMPPLPVPFPAMGSPIGIDPAPLDPADPEDAAWLGALIWPEQRARAERLTAALALAIRLRPKVIAGDGNALLPRVARSLLE